MRPQEYLALKWSDVNLNKGTATVRLAIVWSQKKKGGWHFDEPKTIRSQRTIPLPASTVKALIEHRRRQGEERLRIGSEWQDYGRVNYQVRKPDRHSYSHEAMVQACSSQSGVADVSTL